MSWLGGLFGKKNAQNMDLLPSGGLENTDTLAVPGSSATEARELINRIQNQRKTQELDVADRIHLQITGDDELLAAIDAHRATIMAETLAVSLETSPGTGDVDINGHPCSFQLQKA